MKKIIFSFLLAIQTMFSLVQAQTREELERQRQQLKREIEETEKLLTDNKAKTKENLYQWRLINNKVNLQDKVIENISNDLKLISNDIYQIQRDISRYDKLLDTLKQEYAKSMVYAYKNRSNYDFLNFIFSASSFNDALKRIAYLKSYRNYREIQGQNILRTQELRKKKIQQLTDARVKKGLTLEEQNSEMLILETQQKEKDQILNQLKRQGKELNQQIAAKQTQMKKVNNAIRAAIARAIAEEKARKKKEDEEKEKQRKAALAANVKTNPPNSNPPNNANTNATKGNTNKNNTPPANLTKVATPTPAKKESVLLNDDNVALNNSFEKNKGSLPWPVDRGVVLMHYGANKLPSGSTLNQTSVTISSDISSPVKAVFDGVVSTVTNVDDMQVVIVRHGKYFSTYSNLSAVSVSKGQTVKTGQVIGRVAANIDGVGSVDLYISNETNEMDPESWLKRR